MNDLNVGVREVFARVTRYPLEVLDPASGLEEDLGIDSVKLGEVFAVLREQYGLPEQLELPREQLKTIAGIAQALHDYLRAAAAVKPEQVSANNAEPNGAQPTNGHSRAMGNGFVGVAAVQEIFARVTRYPLEVLDPASGLEEDLGIDSVKLGEVFAVLREQYGLPEQLDLPREQLKTIAGIAEALQEYISKSAAPPEPVIASNGNSAHSSSAAAPVAVSESSSLQSSESDLLENIQKVFAEVTRYPLEILDPVADLEEDLGIDSVKLGEVFSVLRERYRLPAELEIPRNGFRTLRDIAAGLKPYVNGSSSALLQSPQSSASDSGSAGVSTANVADATIEPAVVMTSAVVSQAAAFYAYEKPNSKPFTGKVLFVSGSGRGLGKDIATYLGELGASVVINSFHSRAKGDQTAEEIRDLGGDAIHLWGSMANPEHVDRVFDEIEAQYGHLDFFIGNASNGMLARLEDITVEHWEKAYRTNVIGLHQSALRAVKLMRPRGGGKIITLSSPAAHGYVDYFGCMGTVKAAVESLTRSMAIEFAPYNIQVNCVSPGPVYGELLNKWPDSERLIAQWESNTAYKRLCEPRDVSHFIAYLLSEPVKLFTGSVLIMDGGISSQGW
jgi:NAD(P)-dependent dehydrogenase (short-subunit alcohol dehydrogenase family)/acyl carrier protein